MTSRSGPTGEGAHLEMDELLALRDGTASAAASGHLRTCPACRREVERLHQMRAQLRALPSRGPSRDLWPRLRERITAERRERQMGRLWRLVLAGAAAVLVALAVPPAFERRERALEREQLELAVVDLRERSQLLDGELRSLRTRALSAWRAEAIVYLEDELDELDELLREKQDAPPSGEEVTLWLNRLELQSAMVDMHVAPVTRVDL